MSVRTERLAHVADTGDPPYDVPEYVASRLRAPKRPLVLLPDALIDATGAVFGDDAVSPRDHDPIYQAIRDPRGRARLVSELDMETTQPEWALGYRFDVVLGGTDPTPLED